MNKKTKQSKPQETLNGDELLGTVTIEIYPHKIATQTDILSDRLSHRDIIASLEVAKIDYINVIKLPTTNEQPK